MDAAAAAAAWLLGKVNHKPNISPKATYVYSILILFQVVIKQLICPFKKDSVKIKAAGSASGSLSKPNQRKRSNEKKSS